MVPGSLFKKSEFLNKPIAVRHIAPALLSRPGPTPVAALFFQAFEALMIQKKKFVFTDRLIKQLPSHDPSSASKSAEYSDATVIGLRAVVGVNGNKSFSFRYQLVGGRKRCARIGTFPAITVSEARKIALEMRAVVDRGDDPQDRVDRMKAMPTFAEFWDNEYAPYAIQAKKSFRNDESKVRIHLKPRFGSLRLCDIGVRDVQLHHAAMKASHTAATANRHLALLSAIFRKAVEWERIDKNPAAGIKPFREVNQHQRFLTSDEIARIFQAMDGEANKTAVAALKLLLLTGTRREEALQARWEHVDLDAGQWWLPITKAGRGRYVALSGEAKDLLAALPSRGHSPWVFPGRDGDKPLNNPRKAFGRILESAGVEHLRIHDLRHSFASLAVNAGATLYQVQGLLGHSSAQMTQRYAHLADNGLRDASQAVAKVVMDAVKRSVTKNGDSVAQSA
ncbi:tyrosine-type recombinase/integrase [Stutzerimonas frequens]|uniref:tyrosine-type recombinase/integrase n=1 Tax=Stutzerimonas frequens TaxID=2968969 RepID=UPI0012E30C6B|nr:site-specific integrase [Stutzerimonas frequens]MUT70828.1 tyrosine-type recombinase/integrase [Stutzerimonas frequens]